MPALDVIALDPGNKVGWARATVEPDGTWTGLEHGIHHLKDMALALDRKVSDYDAVVCETWRLRPAKARAFAGSDFPSVQFIGMVRLGCWRENVRYYPQDPSIKSTADKSAPPWLKEIIDNEPGTHDDGHNVDALRHLWFWTWENYVIKT
jgi:hypothetical protein